MSPPSSARLARQRELETYLARSRRVRRTTSYLGLGLAAVAVALWLAGVTLVAAVAGLTGGAIAGCGAWITWGHIQEFERELRSLREPAGSRRVARRRRQADPVEPDPASAGPPR